jgi:hypothetical protein
LLYDDLKNQINDERFNDVVNDSFIYVNRIADCDYVVLPYKWRGMDDITKKIIDDCQRHSKKILIFYNDDSDEKIPVDEKTGLIFRTSFDKSSKNTNEFSLPPFFIDEFSNNFIQPEDINLSIGFCGLDHYYRKQSLENIKNNEFIKSDFIIRKTFWAKEVSEEEAIQSFNNNIINNLFGFTSKGSGNFSYRFYQILSMGRIPVLLNTDCELPFSDEINYDKTCLIIDVGDIANISNFIIDFYRSRTKEQLYQMQIDNRNLYLEYLSPNGFIKKIKNILK